MNRLLACTTVALFLGLTPALATDKSTMAPAGTDTSSGAAQQSSAPVGSDAAMDNAKKPGSAITPTEGSMDTSSGAAQQSSAPPSSAAADPSNPKQNGSLQ